MIGVLKVLFDLSVFFSLFGFYVQILTGQTVFFAGLVALCAAGGLWLLLQQRTILRYLALLFPAVCLFFWPGIWSSLPFFAGWAYFVWCLLSQRTGCSYWEFRQHFYFGLRVQLLILPAFFFYSGALTALTDIAGCWFLLLLFGVFLLRALRQNQSSGRTQSMVLGGITVFCAVLTLLGIPDYLASGARWLYDRLAIPLIQGAGTVLYVLLSGFFRLLQLLANKSAQEPGEIVPGVQESYAPDTLVPSGTEPAPETTQSLLYLWYVTLGVLAVIVCVLLVRKLMGNKQKKAPASAGWQVRKERIRAPGTRFLHKPRNPRGQVRYYYALYLQLCRKRGLQIQPGQTARELAHCSSALFSGEENKQLSALYLPARYCQRQPVTPQQAEEAARLWKKLRHSPKPEQTGDPTAF